MSDAVISALITGGLALIGVIVTVVAGNSKIQHKMDVAQAVTDTKIEELTREVREHNGFARRVPVLEARLQEAERRIEGLEQKDS